jgi:hypothetical protein
MKKTKYNCYFSDPAVAVLFAFVSVHIVPYRYECFFGYIECEVVVVYKLESSTEYILVQQFTQLNKRIVAAGLCTLQKIIIVTVCMIHGSLKPGRVG